MPVPKLSAGAMGEDEDVGPMEEKTLDQVPIIVMRGTLLGDERDAAA